MMMKVLSLITTRMKTLLSFSIRFTKKNLINSRISTVRGKSIQQLVFKRFLEVSSVEGF
jgi:hypothetical protein